MRIVGYTYAAEAHCIECTRRDADCGVLVRQPPLLLNTDQHGIAQDLIDREGNSLHPIFSTDEQADYCCCECVRRFLDRRGNTDPEND